jgi:hypothetical protein
MLLRYGRSVWQSGQGCFSAKTGPRASRRCVHCLRGPSGETWILWGWLPLPEAGLGRGEVVTLEWTEPWLNRTHQAFAALCWWGLPAEIRSLGGTPNYGPRHLWNRASFETRQQYQCWVCHLAMAHTRTQDDQVRTGQNALIQKVDLCSLPCSTGSITDIQIEKFYI